MTLNNSFAPALICFVVISIIDLVKSNEELKSQSKIIMWLCIAQSALFMFGLFMPRNRTKGDFRSATWIKYGPWLCNSALVVSTAVFPGVIFLSVIQARILFDKEEYSKI